MPRAARGPYKKNLLPFSVPAVCPTRPFICLQPSAYSCVLPFHGALAQRPTPACLKLCPDNGFMAQERVVRESGVTSVLLPRGLLHQRQFCHRTRGKLGAAGMWAISRGGGGVKLHLFFTPLLGAVLNDC